jgi:hypothetical protein
MALWVFLAFYVVCVAVTWTAYVRPRGTTRLLEVGGSGEWWGGEQFADTLVRVSVVDQKRVWLVW